MKLLSTLLLSTALAMTATCAWAQANTIPSQPHLLVKGEGSRTVMPDRFALRLRLESVSMDTDAARRVVQDNTVAAMELFKRHHAIADTVRADNLRIEPEQRYERDRQVFVGSKVSRELRGSFETVAQMQAFLAGLKVSEELQVSSVAPTYSGEADIRRELKAEAAAQTRGSAAALAKAYGARIGSLYSISDVAPDFAYGVQAGQWPASDYAEARPRDVVTVTGSRFNGESIQAGPITYTENVYAIFLITDGS